MARRHPIEQLDSSDYERSMRKRRLNRGTKSHLGHQISEANLTGMPPQEQVCRSREARRDVVDRSTNMSTKKSQAVRFMEKVTGGPVTFGKLIESIRKGEEMTQPDFAAKLNLSKSHLNDIEKGRKLVSPERAARFAKLLGYSQTRFVKLALQDLVDRNGLKLAVEVTAA